MAILEITRGQRVRIPAIQLTNNQEFQGVIRASDGETLVIEVDEAVNGLVPEQVEEMCVLTWQSDGMQRACPIMVRNRAPRAIVGQVVLQERRKAPRVRAEVQVVYELIAPERVREVADEVMAQVNTLGDPHADTLQLLRNNADPMEALRGDVAALREMIGELMARIDHLTTLVIAGPQPETTLQRQPLSVQNCSSTGLGLFTQDAPQEGDYVRLRLTLRTTPQTVIDCVGVVVRSLSVRPAENSGGATVYDVGIHYTHIHESDRERMIQYLFKVQRRILRDLKEARVCMTTG